MPRTRRPTASQSSTARLRQSARTRTGSRSIRAFSSAQLDLALGRSNVVHAALLAGPASDTFLARLARFERFRTGEPGGSGAQPAHGTDRNRDGMAETKTPGGKTLSVGGKSTLSLKPRTETGMVRQSFSHGRSKQVVVEVRSAACRRRQARGAAPAPAAGRRRQARGPAAPRPSPTASRAPSLRAAAACACRARAEAVRRRAAHPDRRRAQRARPCARRCARARSRRAQDRRGRGASVRAQRDAIEKAEREAAEARKREEDERRKHDEETKRKADEVAKKRFGEGETTTTHGGAPGRAPGVRPALEAEEEEAPRFRRGPGGAMRPAAPPQRPTRAARPRPNGRAAA